MHTIMTADRASPVAKETVARTPSRSTSGFRTARQRSVPRLERWSFARTLGPCSARRAEASSKVNPPGRVRSKPYTASGSIPADSTRRGDTRIAALSCGCVAKGLLGRTADGSLGMRACGCGDLQGRACFSRRGASADVERCLSNVQKVLRNALGGGVAQEGVRALIGGCHSGEATVFFAQLAGGSHRSGLLGACGHSVRGCIGGIWCRVGHALCKAQSPGFAPRCAFASLRTTTKWLSPRRPAT